ncbi:MAG: acyloxyacyl hydrolase [Alphaproteobacteria bacterium]|nr:acyloxyacyl hydrolase [Alphaproteobacteria bacterium]
MMAVRTGFIGIAVSAGVAALVPGFATAQTMGQPVPPPAYYPAPYANPAPPPAPYASPARPPGAYTFAPVKFGPLTLEPVPISGNLVDELKIGGLAHDVTLGGHHLETGADVNVEMLFTPPDFLSVIGSPRPHIGADINTSGNTSDGYFGLTWGISLIQSLFQPNDSVFVNGSLGGAVQDGYIDSSPPTRKKLGSRILFRESAELGYQLTPITSVSTFVDHISNANLGQHNAGITSVGGRLGFKF